EDRVHERVTERVVQGLVRIRNVDPVAEQRRRKVLGARPMTRDRERLVLGLVPPVLAAVALPWLHVDGVVGQDRERRHAVLAVILVLVVTPEQHEVGPERVQLGASLPEMVNQVVAVLLGVRGALVGAPLLTRRRMPSGRGAQRFRQEGVRDQKLDAAGHVALVGERRVVRDAEAEDLAHRSSSSQSANGMVTDNLGLSPTTRVVWPFPVRSSATVTWPGP